VTGRRLSPGLVQVAGIRDEDEARLCLDAGVDLLGFPFRLPVHREDLAEAEAAALIAALGIGSRSVLITYLETARELVELADLLGTGWVQIHGRIVPSELRLLREARPGLGIIRSLVLRSADLEQPMAELVACSPWVDAFLTDSHDPASGADGATGRVHDWSLSRRLGQASTRPLILAGGLRPDNVAAAIAAVGPAGVDAHTGLEDAAGAKDPALVAAFVDTARRAFRTRMESTGDRA
jgi:phosphoribosylanthranilate isomerase